MTQPEETTAALIARLHEQLKIKELQLANVRKSEAVHVDLAHKAYQERDASFAATSKAQDERDQVRADLEASKTECLQWRKDIDEERRQVAFRDSMIATMTKQMDESDRDRVRVCNEQRARAEKTEALLTEERRSHANEVRAAKQLLGEMRSQQDGGRDLLQCINDVLGQLEAGRANLRGAEDTSEYYRRFNERADREKARAESAEHKIAMLEAEVTGALATAKTLLEAKNAWADRCAELQKALIDARAESLRAGLAGKEMAENCDAISAECLKAQALAQEAGAKCDRAIKERDEAREQLAKLECRTRPAHWRTLDRLARREMHGLYESFLCQGAKIKPVPCSLCLQPDVTSKPHPHARCANHAASEPSSTEPRFKVGQRVVETAIAWEVGEILLGAYEWWYRAPGSTWVEESKLKPAPKFAVGEWVRIETGGSGEVSEVSAADGSYIYNLGGPIGHWEERLTAQTPQHKHDCMGCVFLGRMGEWDLWFSTKGSDFVPGPTVFANGGSDPLSDYCEWSALESTGPRYRRDVYSSMDQTMEEARRRAVARGLVKP